MCEARDDRAAVAVFKTHIEAENGVRELQKSGVDMKKLSIVGKDYHTEEDVVGYYNTGARMKTWGKLGAFWGGLWGLLFGSAFFWVPGLGPLVVAGPLVAWLVGSIEGAVVGGGIGVIGAGLLSVGIPKDSVIRYEQAIKASKFLVIVHGSSAEVTRAKEIMQGAKAEVVESHDSIDALAPDSAANEASGARGT